MGRARILIIDDEPLIAKELKARLTAWDYDVVGIANSGKAALEMAAQTRPHVALVDMFLSGELDSSHLAEEMRATFGTSIAYLTTYPRAHPFDQRAADDSATYILKPVSPSDLRRTVDLILLKHDTEKKLGESRRKLSDAAELQRELEAELDAEQNQRRDLEQQLLVEQAERRKLEEQLERERDHRRRLEDQALEEEHDREHLIRQVQEAQARREEMESRMHELEARHDETADQTDEDELILQETDRRLALIFDQTPVACQALDEEGRVVRVNKAWLEMLGYDQNDVIGRWFGDFLSPESQAKFVHDFPLVREQARVHAAGYDLVRADGSPVSVAIDGRVIFDTEGRFRSTHCVLADVSELRRSQSRTEASHVRLRTILHNMPVLMDAFDEENRIVFWNAECERVTGYSAEEIVGSPEAMALLYPDDSARDAMFAEIENTPLHFRGKEWDLVTKSGERRTISWSNITEECPIAGWHSWAVGVDVTDRRRAEMEQEETTRRLELAMTGARMGWWEWDMSSDDLLINEQWGQITGHSLINEQRDILWWKDLLHPEDRPNVLERLDAHLSGAEQMYEAEYRFRHASGQWRWALSRGQVVEHDEQGSPLRMAGTFLDVTGRREAEERIANQVHFLESLLQAIPSPVYYRTPDGALLGCNAAFERFVDLSRDDIVDRPASEILSPGLAGLYELWRQEWAAPAFPARMDREISVQAGDGTNYTLIVHEAPFSDIQGAPQGIIGMLLDISGRKEAEQALRESEERLRLLTGAIDEVFWMSTPGVTEMIYVSPAYERLWSRPVEEVYRRPLSLLDGVHEQDRPVVRAALAGHAKGDYACQYRIIRPDGTVRWIDDRGFPVRDEDGRLKFMAGIARDITEQKQAESELEQWSDRLVNILESISDGFLTLNDRLEVTYFNAAAEKLLARPRGNLLGRYLFEAFPEAQGSIFEKSYRQALRDRRPMVFETYFEPHDQWYDVRVYPYQDGISAFFQLTTEHKKSEELVLQAERYKAVAGLAAGVAHNFNNLLQIIIGNADLALSGVRSGDMTDMEDNLEQILGTARLGAETVQRLNSFAKAQNSAADGADERFALSEVVAQAMEMTRPWWQTEPEKRGIKVVLRDALNDPCMVSGHKAELFEVIVNLIKNSCEAVADGGEILLTTREQGDKVILTVEDNGPGIPEADLEKLFTPFFSTKKEAGTGLGLATSRTIVTRHQGTIRVASTIGEGTIFTVTLPKAHPAAAGRVRDGAPRVEESLSILAIDDMDAVLTVLKRGLEQHGHTVSTALSGEAGIRLFKEVRVDVVICDLAMPEENGWEVARAVRQICHEHGLQNVSFIILTGWGDQLGPKATLAGTGVDAVVEKPVDLEALLHAINAARRR